MGKIDECSGFVDLLYFQRLFLNRVQTNLQARGVYPYHRQLTMSYL